MKIIVVDDEPLVRQYIVQCVRDAGENEITAAVSSGAKVLQEMKDNPADVVFADITMPKMDGIELLKELKKQYPSTAVIMLTCHDDFEYARAAMQSGARDYILKTEVSADKIREALDKLENSHQQQLAKDMAKEMERGRFLRHLVDDQENIPSVKVEDLKKHSIYLEERAYLAVVFLNRKENTEIIQRYLQERFENSIFFIHSEQEAFLLTNVKREAFSDQKEAVSLFYHCALQLRGGIGCSDVHHHVSHLQRAFAEAVRDFDAGFYQVPAQELPRESHVREVETGIMRASVKLMDGDIRGGCIDLERLLKYVGEYKVRSCFVLEAVQKLFSRLAVKRDQGLQEIADIISSCCTFAALCEAVREGIAILQPGYSVAIRKAVDHIHHHYAEDLSLNTVADVVFLNRDYLSRQFKKEVGVNFSEYLMKVRMKQARRLLENSSLRISEVACSIGIMNVSYFSTVFHKTFGCKPNDVRKNKQEE